MQKQIVTAVKEDKYWLLKYVNKAGYVASTWSGADTFKSKESAIFYANNHYQNKLKTE